jgi:catechol 2,3-dioxygenase-like lactoylglutathione lyase family enzyme
MISLFVTLAALALAEPAPPRGHAVTPGALPPLTEATRPTRFAGVGLYVSDIEKMRAFYVEVLGMKVIQRVPAQGPLREYLLSFESEVADGPVVVLTKAPTKLPPKRESYGRLIFAVPDGAIIARRAAQAGYPPARIVEGANTITDPEGHRIELFQRGPSPAAK